MNAKRTFAISKKEIRDTLRDRRTIIAMVVIPILVLPLLTLFPAFLANPQRNPVKVAVIQEDESSHALVQALNAREISLTVLPKTANLTQLVQDGVYEIGLVLPQNFAAVLQDSRAVVTVRIVVDEATPRGAIAVRLIQGIVSGFSSRIVAQRVAQSGLPPEALAPIRLTIASVSQVGGGALLLTLLLPMFLGIYSVMGSLHFVIDTTAGEKERRTLEALLTAPVTRSEIVVGKFLVAIVIALTSSLFAMAGIAFGVTLLVRSLDGSSSLNLSISPLNIMILGVGTLLLAMTSAAVEMVIAVFAKTFREAQTLVSPLTLVIVVPALAMQYLDQQTLRAFGAVPFLNAMLAMRFAILNQPDTSSLALNLGSALVYMILAVAVAVKIFHSERIVARV